MEDGKSSKTLDFPKKVRQRLEWIIYYETKTEKNNSLVCRYVGITKSKWYFWKNKFNEDNLRTLEDNSFTALNKRKK